MARYLLQRRDTAIADAARDDQAEVVEIAADVEREAVARNPPRDAHADGADLLGSDPRTGEPLDASGGDTVIGAHANHHVLDVAHVAMDVASIRPEIDDRVPDDLPWSVIRDVPSATGLMDGDA